MGTKRRVGWVLSGASALLWAAAGWVGLTFEGVTGPSMLLGGIFLCALPLTFAAAIFIVLGRREETRRAREHYGT